MYMTMEDKNYSETSVNALSYYNIFIAVVHLVETVTLWYLQTNGDIELTDTGQIILRTLSLIQ